MQLNAQSMSRYTRNSNQIKGLWFEKDWDLEYKTSKRIKPVGSH